MSGFIFKATPGSFCDLAGHDGLREDDHYEKHEQSLTELAEEGRKKQEDGWKLILTKKTKWSA